MLPKGLDFTTQQLEKIEKILRQLRWDTEAQCILLADITGHLISVQGEAEMNTAVLSALAAGNVAATNEMAKLVGEPARFKMLFHEGHNRSVFLSDVGEEMVLITVINNQTPIGLVRLGARQAVVQLVEIAEGAIADGASAKGATTADQGRSAEQKESPVPGNFDWRGTSLADELNASLDTLFES